ncbi:MAG: DEAD/DEAH box helicase [Bacteroidota bacterium]
MNFSDFDLHSQLLEGLEAMGFKTPTPIQSQAIPIVKENHDLIACAQTGTGKTGAFLLPLIDKISSGESDNLNTLIITPTRELAIQIDQQLQGLSYFTETSSLAIYGGADGASFEKEKRALTKGANIVIATPGRLIAHLNLGYVEIGNLKHLVLDEADRMLDMGFYEDIMKIESFLPKKRQTLLFSATMPTKIRSLAKKVLVEPKEINIAISKPAERIFQAAFMAYDHQKVPLIEHLLSSKNLSSVIIFTSTKKDAKELSRTLKKLDFSCGAIHSDLEQGEREDVLRSFKNQQINMLIATDILSRGIDVEGVDLVINFDVPSEGEDYIHRIGRTARAEARGIAFTLINEKDVRRFYEIEQLLEKEIPKGKLPDGLGDAPKYNTERFKRKGNNRSNAKRRSKPRKR